MRVSFCILLLIILTSCFVTEKTGTSFYKIDLKLDVNRQLLNANVDLTYYAKKERVDTLTFYLHRNLFIETLTCKNLGEYTFNTEDPCAFPFTPEAGTLTIHLSKPLQKNEALQINLQYVGKIGVVTQWEINRITREWIELGMYTPWFPYQPAIGNFAYIVDVKIDPEYQVIGMGKTNKLGDYWQILQENPTNDIIIMAAKKIHTKKSHRNSKSVDISYTATSDSTAVDMMEQGLWVLDNYREWFGDIKAYEASIVIAPRNVGGGYARRGFVVFNHFEDEDYYQNKVSYFRYIAHEFAHIWWLNAPTDTCEDWLNESFAEYSALMAVREKFGNEAFKNLIQAKRQKSKNMPAIKGIDRMDENASTVLYDKGCILLHELEAEIGNDNFLQLLKRLVKNKVKSTEQFLKVLTDLSGIEVSNKFEKKLSR